MVINRNSSLNASTDPGLAHLWATLRGSGSTSRRDLLRWSAIVAGAVATSTSGIGSRRASAAAARQDAAVATGVEISVPFDAYGTTFMLDPHRSPDYGGFWVMYPNVWAGLLGFDENGGVVLDLAETAVVSDDGLSYTFTLLPDLSYASGNSILAEHFITSWKRALDPANLSPMAQFMSLVEGFDAWIAGEEGAELGFEAPDEKTLIVRLSEPATYFPSYMATFVWAVVDPAVIEAFGQTNFVLNYAGAGPWAFSAYTLDEVFEMTPNPYYYGGPNPSISKIIWPIVTGPTAAQEALDLYLSDQAVSADVPLSLLEQVQADPVASAELRVLDAAPTSVRSLAMNFARPPFDDVRVRQAFGLAFDRVSFVEPYGGTWVPAMAFTPPSVTQLTGYEPPVAPEVDVDAARALLEEAGVAGENFPEVIYYHPTEDTDLEKDRIRSMLGMLGGNLGVTLLFDPNRTQEQIDAIRADEGVQLELVWWQSITMTPHLLTEVFRSDSPYMAGIFNWSPDLPPVGGFDPGAASAQFDELVAQADQEADTDTRNELFAQAEQLMLDNAVYVPIANWTPMYVQKPWLVGTRQGSWTGRLPIVFDADVVVLA